MSKEMSAAELEGWVASAVVERADWESPRRVNLLALSDPDARESLEQTFGEGAQVGAVVFRSTLLGALIEASGAPGYWVADQGGEELFLPMGSPELAWARYIELTGREPISLVGTQEILESLAEMDQALSGDDPYMVISQALVRAVASRSA